MRHGDIWRGLDALAERHGLSVSGLAKLAGLDPTSFNKSKRTAKDGRPRWPTTESLSRVLDAVNVDLSEFAALVTEKPSRQLPLIRQSQSNADAVFDEDGQLNLSAAVPQSKIDLILEKGAYVFQVEGREFEPKYTSGDCFVVSPSTDLGDRDQALIMPLQGELCVARYIEKPSEPGPVFENVTTRSDVYSLSQVSWAAKIIWIIPQN